ncbi:hypothetical protein DL96DRAFT_1526225 [Flagelloscypha sp. PMI_526]|nr:hypothetical protein DL96DRAFT_1526225 [Flagelloscypha sp. PMI_526]
MAPVSLVLAFIATCICVAAQTTVGDLPSPPLQYINLSGLLHGSTNPPGLKNAAIGYDPGSRSLIIFGGEANGFAQANTYLLNLDTLTWSLPRPPANLPTKPPARSSAVFGTDFAASNRHSFVVVGGKGDNDQALSDVWEFDWVNQFWAQVQMSPGGPSPRWAAAGGIDYRVAPISDPKGVPGPNNTVYLTGGTDGSHVFTDGLWSLQLAGTLSANLPDNALGSWNQTVFDKFPPLQTTSGAAIGQKLIAAGTCSNSSTNACSLQDFQVIDSNTKSFSTHAGCPAPKLDAVMVPNLNGASNAFTSQALLLFGTYDVAAWSDDGGLTQGEVDILDLSIGSWVRVVPAGDPGSNNQQKFPSPRQGAAAFSYHEGLVGSSRASYTDTIIFGGQTLSGDYLDDLWILRSYNDRLTPRNATFKDGALTSGIDANGSGVKLRWITQCASSLQPTSTSSPNSPTSTGSSPHSGSFSVQYSTPTVHKVLSSISIAAFLAALIGVRLSVSPTSSSKLATAAVEPPKELGDWGFLWYLLIAILWGIGIAGLASGSALTTAEASASPLTRRDITSYRPKFLETNHGRAGFALFVCLYGILPLLVLFDIWRSWQQTKAVHSAEPETVDLVEKLPSKSPSNNSKQTPQQHQTLSVPRLSDDSTSTNSHPTPSSRTFEVLNRGQGSRGRRSSIGQASSSSHPGLAVASSASRQLGEVDWLQRRRTLNAVGELDYAISQVLRNAGPPTPAQEHLLQNDTMPSHLMMPSPFVVVFRLFLHAVLLGCCVLILVALWYDSPHYSFAIFLVWIVLFYISMVFTSWRQLARRSVLTVLIARLQGHGPIMSPNLPPISSPDKTPSPYLHTPSHTLAHPDQTPAGARSVDTDHEDDDEDEDETTAQRRMEEEMDRRQVSIVTVPKRKLWVTNPEAAES